MTKPEHALHAFMTQVTAEMASEYQRIFTRTAEDPGTAGDEGEENWATLLREWLPPNFHVATKGRLIGPDGSMSPQIDVLVLKPFYPPKLREKKVWLADGVAAAFECKTTLRAEHLRASVDRCRQFKSLFARRTGSPERELRSPLVYGVLAHSHGWKAPASRPADNVTAALEEASRRIDHPSDLIDLVCLADVAAWSATTTALYRADWNPAAGARLRGEFGGDWGIATAMICADGSVEQEQPGFQPIGAALAYLTQRLAWSDPSIRDLADYYRRTSLWGSGSGDMRFWPWSTYSDVVRQQIEQGRLENGDLWDEWNIALI